MAQQGRARLLHYEPVSSLSAGLAPVLFVPSLINTPAVLDLAPDNSLLRFLSAEGHDVYQIDWGSPGPGDGDLDMAGHVTDLLLPLIARLAAPPIIVGYCLGGTIAIAAAALTPCVGLATIGTPWDFDAYPDVFREQTGAAWTTAEPICRDLGVMPMEVLQAGFWSLDPQRTIRKYARFADMAEDDPGHAAFLLVEDWLNAGAPLTFAAGRDLIQAFYGNNITQDGNWRVGGTIIDASAMPCPSLAISSTTDRIAPHAARPPATETLTLGLGHVGMVVGRSAPDLLWRPLSQWLRARGG